MIQSCRLNRGMACSRMHHARLQLVLAEVVPEPGPKASRAAHNVTVNDRHRCVVIGVLRRVADIRIRNVYVICWASAQPQWPCNPVGLKSSFHLNIWLHVDALLIFHWSCGACLRRESHRMENPRPHIRAPWRAPGGRVACMAAGSSGSTFATDVCSNFVNTFDSVDAMSS